MSNSSVTSHGAPAGALWLRLTWMAAPVAILLFMFLIAETPPWTISTMDLWVAGFALAAIGARAVDVYVLRGLTAEGDPATGRHFARYAGTVALAAAGLWFVAQSIQL